VDSGTSRLAQHQLTSRDVITANLQADNEKSGIARHFLSPKANISFATTLAPNGAKIMCANARVKANAVYVAQRTVGVADRAWRSCSATRRKARRWDARPISMSAAERESREVLAGCVGRRG
jgi:hypothetical protein